MKYLLTLTLSLALLGVAGLALAQAPQDFVGPPAPATRSGGLVPCSGADCGFDDIVVLINNLIRFIVMVVVPVGTIAMVIAGVMLVAYPNNEAKRSQAKAILWSAVVGLAVVLASWLIVTSIVRFLGAEEYLKALPAQTK